MTPNESTQAEGWHAPGLGEVHNHNHTQMIYCDNGDGIPDDALATKVCAALSAPPPVKHVHEWFAEPNQPGVFREVCSCGALRSGVCVTPVAAVAQPVAINATMVYGALTDHARQRTSRENIEDVLAALAASPSCEQSVAQAAAQEAPPWTNLNPWMRDFLGRGESFVKILYNEPHDVVRQSEVGAWIQVASQILQRMPAALAATPSPEALPAMQEGEMMKEAHRLGFLRAAGWAQRDDLFTDVRSPTYFKDRDHDLAAIAQAAPAAASGAVVYIQKDHLQKAMRAPFLCRVEPTQRLPDFVPIFSAAPAGSESGDAVVKALRESLEEMVSEAETHCRSPYCDMNFEPEMLARAYAALQSSQPNKGVSHG